MSKKTNQTRRNIVIAGAAAASSPFWFNIATAQSSTIKIGFPVPLTGPFSAEAQDQVRAAELAIKEFNVEDAESQMFASNSNLRNQYIGLELQQSATSLQRSFLYPTLSFQAGVNPGWSKIREIKDGNVNISTTNLSYYGNFNLRYTLFNNWKNQRAVEVSKIGTRAAPVIDE